MKDGADGPTCSWRRCPPVDPSANLLLATLAVFGGSGALAVVLTDDGARARIGLRAVARRGGTLYIYDGVCPGGHGRSQPPPAAGPARHRPGHLQPRPAPPNL